MSEESKTGLIVPIDIVAFCVSEVDENMSTGKFSGATTDYAFQLTAKTHASQGSQAFKAPQAFLGSNVVISLADPPCWPLKQGIHIHWALPDALTRATVNGDTLDFPAAPNRWLLTRFVLQGMEVSTKSWILESDALSAEAPEGQKPVTMPISNEDKDNFRYVGHWQVFDKDWRSKASEFKSLMGSELNAASSGVPSFAAYYPDCHSVFGFWDQLEDIDIKGAGVGTVRLMYAVTGWHDCPENDPLKGVDAPSNIEPIRSWTFKGIDSAIPSYTIYNGIVQGIDWDLDPDKRYVEEQPAKPLEAKASLGNNPAEALSAYFKSLNHPEVELFEPLLNAFQMGFLSTFQKPQPNRLEGLFESLHEKTFSSKDSGTLYTIVKKGDGGGVEGNDQEVLIDLPLHLADELNKLNICQQKYDRSLADLNGLRWQLFADWYRIFVATDPTTYNTANLVASHRFHDRYKELSDAFSTASKELSGQRSAVDEILKSSKDLMLKPVPAPRYYQPAEPVVLLDCDELKYPSRYGGVGRSGNLLSCRLSDRTLKSVNVHGKGIDASQFRSLALPEPNGLPHSDLCSSLLIEACLLNTQLAAALTGTGEADLRGALEKLLAGDAQSTYQVSGDVPSIVGMNWWQGNPWLPIFLHWKANIIPLLPTSQNNRLVNYAAEFFTDNFDIDQDAGGAIAYMPGDGPHSIVIDPETAKSDMHYDGETLLLPSSAENFKDQLNKYLHPESELNPQSDLDSQSDPTLQAILDHLNSSNILVQPLSGFNNALLMRSQSLQLNISVPSGSIPLKNLTRDIRSAVGDLNSTSPQNDSYFNPIRAGYLKNLELKVVDVFGQRRDIQLSWLTCAESMIAFDKDHKLAPSAVYLEPRIAQPGRLLFRWISADSIECEEMNSHPVTSPICGWLLPNHIDGGFFIYNQQGRPMGTLYLNGDESRVEWQSAPGDDSIINKPVEEVLRYENPQLMKIAVALKGSSSFFKAFWTAVDSAHGIINPQNLSSSSGLAVLVGRPIALVQAMLRMEVEGSPALNQSWDCFTGNDHKDTDNNFTGVEFPVILGDQSQLDDGLVGYFKQGLGGI